ncbi:MAG: GbsR/MarR family transcriptional regulator [Opitutales bacterium]
MSRPSKAEGPASPSEAEAIAEWQVAVIDMFIHAVQALGLPKSLGQIYGLLFTSDEPLTMDAIAQKLSISVGSTSQGLRLLRQFGAVRTLFVIGNRREHYLAERSLRRFSGGFLNEVVEPHLLSGQARLEHLDHLVEHLDGEEAKRARDCRESLGTWLQKTKQLLPLIKNFL